MICVLFLALVTASAADSVIQEGGDIKLEQISDSPIIRELIRRVEFLEGRDKKHVESIDELKQEVTTLKNDVSVLNKKNEKQDRVISTLMHHLWQRLDTSQPSNRSADDVETPAATKEKRMRVDENGQLRRKENARIWRRGGMAIQRRESEVPVAFTAGLTHRMVHMGAHQNIIFDHVETNIGNGYNSNHGVFTAPVAGIYVFFVSVLADNNREIWCQIVVNGNNKAEVYARGTDGRHDQGSNAIIVQLQKGDDVAIQNVATDDAIYGDAGSYTTFSGFLLLEGIAQSGSIIG